MIRSRTNFNISFITNRQPIVQQNSQLKCTDRNTDGSVKGKVKGCISGCKQEANLRYKQQPEISTRECKNFVKHHPFPKTDSMFVHHEVYYVFEIQLNSHFHPTSVLFIFHRH